MLRNPKITPDHLAKQALVYVRQSTPKQVLHNQESQRLQYALVERARALGWHHHWRMEAGLQRPEKFDHGGPRKKQQQY